MGVVTGTARVRLVVAALLTPLLVAGSVLLAQPASAADPQRAKAAADWLYAQGKNGMPGFNPGSVDTGLTIDAMWGLMAAGASKDQITQLGGVVEKNAKGYATGSGWDHPRDIDAGAMGKVLLAAASLNRDATNFGGMNVRQLAASTVQSNGQAMSLNNENPEDNRSANMFGQSLVMMGLARTGDLPSNTVDFLVTQQCSDGHFAMFYYDKPPKSCDEANAAPDRDGTAMAVMALLAAKEKGVNTAKADASLTKAIAFLKKDQKSDGSFGGGVSTEGANSNSTGLVAAALAAGGATAEANKAATWMATMQLTTQNAGKASDHVGAIAYNKDAFDHATLEGVSGEDPWRRASAQAILAFAPVGYNKVSISGASTPTPDSAITTRWKATGGAAGVLGAPTEPEKCTLIDNGCFRVYAKGSIYDSAHTDPQWIRGAIRDAWGSLGWERGPLGYPKSDEICGLRGNGCVQRFQGGLMYWTAGTGAQPVWGAIGDRYASMGWENSSLGYPTSAEFCGLRDGGCAQRFQGGLMYWNPRTGANPVLGAIGDRYASMGWENSALGYPTGPEFCGLRDGGCGQHFQGGSLYFSPRSGTLPTWGAIREHWARNGWEAGRYGYPVGFESCVPGECRQNYQYGVITWNATRGTF